MHFRTQLLPGLHHELIELSIVLELQSLQQVSGCLLVVHHELVPSVAKFHEMRLLLFLKHGDFVVMQDCEIVFPTFQLPLPYLLYLGLGFLCLLIVLLVLGLLTIVIQQP